MHKAARVLTLLAAIPALAAGQANPPDRAVIEGIVINSQTGRLIPRADVVLRDLNKLPWAKSVRADGLGHFKFKDLDPGTYQLSASRQNFFLDVRHKALQPRLAVVAGELRKDIVLRLLPAAVVTGQVVDDDSDPMQHVQVKLLARTHRAGRMVLDTVGIGLTDDRGIYRIYDVRPGNYYVLAEITPELQAKELQVISTTGIVGVLQVAGTGEAPAEREIAFSPLFFPGTRNFLEAHALPIGPGDEIHADFILRTMPSVSIKGRVTNGITGGAAENPTVSASWSEYVQENAVDVRVSSKDGTFEVRGLAPGLYILRASFNRDGASYRTQQTLDVGPSGADHVLLAALPDSDVAGSVRVDNPPATGTPVRRVAVDFQSNDTPERSSASTGLASLQFQVKLHPGDHYTVSARGLPGDYYLKTVRVSGHDVERNDVMVSDLRGQMELVLSPDGGHIDGWVVDEKGQPINGAVVLIPEETRRGLADLFRKTRANNKGAFTLRGVPPGSYKLLAFDDVDLQDFIDHPELLEHYPGKSESLIVSEKGNYSVPLQIIRAAAGEP
jgi:Carboxypeptidase regulatory-like domain